MYDDICSEDSDNRHSIYPAEIYCPTIKRKSFDLKTCASEDNSDDVVCTLSGDYTSDVLIDALTNSKEFTEANDKLLNIIHQGFAKLSQNL